MEFLLPNTPTDTRYINLYIPLEGSHSQKGSSFFTKMLQELHELQWGICNIHPLLFIILPNPFLAGFTSSSPWQKPNPCSLLSPASVPVTHTCTIPPWASQQPPLPCFPLTLCVLLTSCSTFSSFPPFISSLWPSHCLEGCDLVGFQSLEHPRFRWIVRRELPGTKFTRNEVSC